LLDASVRGARGVLINITGGSDLTLYELTEAANIIHEAVDPEAQIILGAVIDPRMTGELKLTVIATGFTIMPNQRSTPIIQPQRPVPPPPRPFEPPVVDRPRDDVAPQRDESQIPAFLRRRN
jgi:cell division protein FtsZ